MPDVKDFDYFFVGAVHNHVRWADEFAGSFDLSGATKPGKAYELLNAVDYGLRDITGSGRIVLLDAFDCSLQVGQMLRLSTESASRVKEPVDTIQHVFVFYKLGAVGLLKAPLHTDDKAGPIFKHAMDGLFDQLLRILAVRRGNLLKPRFNVVREVYFHTFESR